jgi:hypothetical protein
MLASSAMVHALIAAMAFCVASAWVSHAHAEQEFPGALTDAAEMECVPTCLMCHGVNPGTAGTWTAKPLGRALGAPLAARAGAGDVDAFKAAWASYAADPANAASVDAIKRGREPGSMQDVCGPRYGCGASFTRATPKGSLSPDIAAICLALFASVWTARRRLRGGHDNAA